MKNTVFVIYIITFIFLIAPLALSAQQTDRDLLLRILEKQDQLSQQQALQNAKMEGFQKQMEGFQKQMEGFQKQIDVRFEGVDKRFESIDKRFETQNMYIIAIIGLFGVLIAVIVWDRRTVTKPFESKTAQLERTSEKLEQEILLIKEKELKTEILLKKLAEIEPRFAEALRNASIL
jgi:Flp pilus assembly protein TadB